MTLPALQEAAGVTYRERGTGEPVVFLHGIGSTSSAWRDQYAPLGERVRVVAWTAPGYHASTPLSMERPGVADYTAVLVRLLDALSIERCSVVTNSWGTLIGLDLASRHPARVRALVCGGPSAGGHGLMPEERARRTEERIARMRSLGPARLREEDGPRLLASGAPAHALAWARGECGEHPTVEGYAQAIRMLYATDGVALARGVQSPVLVVSGTEDRITPPELHARKLAAASSAKFEAIPACGHLPHLEVPQTFNALVLKFLEEVRDS